MSDRTAKSGFATRPGDAERWVSRAGRRASADMFTARLTIDVTPAQRACIKLAALKRGVTVADMLRGLLAREFPPGDGGPP